MKNQKIKSWLVSERPRERLFSCGAQALSDAELIAILLRVGGQHATAIDLARALLNKYGGLNALLGADKQQLLLEPNLGPAKVAALKAVKHLCSRLLKETLKRTTYLQSSEITKQYLSLHYSAKQQEIFSCLFLDSQYALIAIEDLFFGTINQSHVYPREIVKSCLKHGASAVILSHNHPSGHHQPSAADLHITQHIKRVLSDMDIVVVDHLIVGNEVYSFAENGNL